MNGMAPMAMALNPQLIERLKSRAIQMNPAIADRLNGWLAQRTGGTPQQTALVGAGGVGPAAGTVGALAGGSPNSALQVPMMKPNPPSPTAGGPAMGLRAGSIGALASGAPRMVRMVSPDGRDQRDVPEHEVEQWMRLGARRLS